MTGYGMTIWPSNATYSYPWVQTGGYYWTQPCDHCLCREPEEWEMGDRDIPHMKCCHCGKLYANEEEE